MRLHITGGRGDHRGNEGGEGLEARVGRLGGEYGGSHTPISRLSGAGSLSSLSLASPPGVRGCVWS